MTVTAAMVKELRNRTGAGMMECKRSLVEVGGDIELAVEQMRKSGLAKADRKAGRIAVEGSVTIDLNDDRTTAVIAEVNCETDFVAGGDDFREFAKMVTRLALERKPVDLESLMVLATDDGQTVEEIRRELIARIGENIQVRRFMRLDAQRSMGTYLHGTRIGVVVALDDGNMELSRNVAMHIAWSNPPYLNEDSVPQDVLNKEKEILREQARSEGKPDNIVDKMVVGRLKKFLSEITLLDQPYVKDPDITVAGLLESAGATVTSYLRYEVGEGIERKDGNFAAEVMAQVKGA